MSERIYPAGDDYDSEYVLHVEPTTDGSGNLELIVIEGEQVATIKLGMNGVRALRLALARWERAQA